MVSPGAASTSIPIDVGRLGSDLDTLAQRTEPGEPGSTRRVFSPAHRDGRTWLADRMVDAGLEVRTDGAGNLIGVRRGAGIDAAPLVTGSHTDSVRGGGRYDGMLGVLGGLEAARALDASATELEHDLWVVDFLGEEPNPWGLSCIGSRGASGGLAAVDLDRDDGAGRPLRDALDAIGCDAEGALAATWPRLHAFVELHIEQGPVLETAGRRIGVVSGIVGVHRMLVDLGGRRDHAGTMPMGQRIDASCAAAEVVLAVERLAGDGGGVGTAGRIEVEPNAINVVPDRARLWVELRSLDAGWIDERAAAVSDAARAAAARRGGTCDISVISDEPPTPMDDEIRDAIRAAAEAAGHPWLDLPSGAEHDTRQLARIAPVGMIFVPSQGGRSHCAEEWTAPADLAAGVETLARTLVALDRTPTIGASR